MNLADLFRGKKPKIVPTLAEAEADLQRAREHHDKAVNDRVRLKDKFGDVVLDGTPEEQVAARSDLEAAEAIEHDAEIALERATVRHAAAQAEADAAHKKQFEAEGRAALADVTATAVEVDTQKDSLAQAVEKWEAAVEKARPYLNDEGNYRMYNAGLYLQSTITYSLRGLASHPGSRELTDESLESWAKRMPPPAEWRLLIAGADRKER